MPLNNTDISAEEWKILEQKIKNFNESVKNFQREIRERLQ
jgi:hypothetical protein